MQNQRTSGPKVQATALVLSVLIGLQLFGVEAPRALAQEISSGEQVVEQTSEPSSAQGVAQDSTEVPVEEQNDGQGATGSSAGEKDVAQDAEGANPSAQQIDVQGEEGGQEPQLEVSASDDETTMLQTADPAQGDSGLAGKENDGVASVASAQNAEAQKGKESQPDEKKDETPVDISLATQAEPVSYVVVDEVGNRTSEARSDCIPVADEQGETTLGSGWYVVPGEVVWEKRVAVNGEVNLILCDGAKLTANEGINVAEGNTLRIYGQELGSGMLEAFSGYEHGNTNSAAIGGSPNENLGAVTIYGGKVHAECKENRQAYNLCYAAGIGGGWDGDGGEVTIFGGVVEAIGAVGAGIGAGSYGYGGTFTMYGGDVDASSSDCGAGIGGSNGYDAEHRSDGGVVAVHGGVLRATGGSSSAGIGGSSSYGKGGDVTITGGEVYATGGGGGAGIGNGYSSYDSGDDGGVINISGGTVVAIGGGQSSGSGGAGLGSGRGGNGGTITISGADTKVTARGGMHAEGIGGADDGLTSGKGHAGTITIRGGTVEATGGYRGAGIGGNNDDTDHITIEGGTVTATGGYGSAGIGGPEESNRCGNICITGGNVTAIGGCTGAGIGSGNRSGYDYVDDSNSHVTIGGTAVVEAVGGKGAAGIGGGCDNHGFPIEISASAVVTAQADVVDDQRYPFPSTQPLGSQAIGHGTYWDKDHVEHHPSSLVLYPSAKVDYRQMTETAQATALTAERVDKCRLTWAHIESCGHEHKLNYVPTTDRSQHQYTCENCNVTSEEPPIEDHVFDEKTETCVCGVRAYRLFYAPNGGNGTMPPSDYVYEGGTLAASACGFSRTGYHFVGWNTQADGKGQAYAAGDSVTLTSNVNLYAKWEINAYTVSFATNGGSAISAQRVAHGKAAKRPEDPRRAGHTFKGWSSDKALGRAYDFSAKVTGDVTLYAKWEINAYTVSFATNGGSAISAQRVAHGKAAKRPEDPRRAGHTFRGWFSDKALGRAYDFSAKVTGDVTLYAKWQLATPPVVSVSAYVQRLGWRAASGGAVAGTTGRALRLEALRITCAANGVAGDIEYRTHLRHMGWGKWVRNGAMSGTVHQSRRAEAVQIRLTGNMEKLYDVWYRVHVKTLGWMAWAKNGQKAGTEGESRRAEAVQIVLVPKGSPAPAKNYKGAVQSFAQPFRKR